MNDLIIISLSVLISVIANYWINKDLAKGLDELNKKYMEDKK